MAFKFVRDAEIKPYTGSIRFIAGGATALVPCRYKHLTQTAFANWASMECHPTAPAPDMAQHALRVLDAWSEITDESDNPLPLDLPSLTALIERHPAAYTGIVVGYVAARGAALEKN